MRLLLALLLAAALAGCERPATPPPAATPAAPAAGTCQAGYEEPDALSPSYRPGAPVRAVVGHGHVLTGTVRSGRDCTPVAGPGSSCGPRSPARATPTPSGRPC